MLTWEDELHQKALDQIAHVHANWEAGRLSNEAYQVAIETVWNCLSGVVRSPEFNELISMANIDARKAPVEPKIRIYERDAEMIVLVRNGEKVTTYRATDPVYMQVKKFDMDDEAIENVDDLTERLFANGFARIA